LATTSSGQRLYRFYRDNDLLESRFGARYIGEMDRMFDTYANCCRCSPIGSPSSTPRPEDTDFVYRQAIRAKALDGLRGLCRRARSRIWEYTPRQAYESLLLRMRAHRCPVREYAQLMLDELVKVIPSFLRRLDVPERGSPGLAIWQTLAAPREPSLRRLVDNSEDEESVRLVALIPKVSRDLEAIVLCKLRRFTRRRGFDAWAV